MKNSNVELLIFDLDGTVIETRSDIANSVNHVRGMLGYQPLDTTLISTFIGDGITMLISRALDTEDPDLIKNAINIFREHYREHCMDTSYLYPGVMETLELLAKNRILVIASNKPEDFTRRMIEGYNLSTYFTDIIGGDTLPFKKPDKQVIQHILHQHNKSPDCALMIGDSANDIHAGKNAGVTTVAVTFGIGNKQKMIDAGPDYIINSFQELTGIVRIKESQ